MELMPMKTNELEVSVSIVTYNNSENLEKRLATLLPIFKANDIKKVYIVDNNSSDATPKILNELAKENPILEVILLKSNIGFGAGHNKAIKSTGSKYHVVMNLDATPKTDDLFQKMSVFMENKKEIDLLSPLILFPDSKIQHLTRNEPTVFDLMIRFLNTKLFLKRQEAFVHLKDGYDHEQKILNATGCFMFFRTETLKKVGGFDERYFLYMEDTDLTKTINLNGQAIFSPEFQVIHEWQRSNHSIKGVRKMTVSMIKYFNKWGWKFM